MDYNLARFVPRLFPVSTGLACPVDIGVRLPDLSPRAPPRLSESLSQDGLFISIPLIPWL
jgi:hypothetical protein